MTKANEYIGVDVSHHDGVIDWAKLYNADCRFAFIKATEGTNFIDPKFAKNMVSAHSAGMLCGCYHFLKATTIEEAIGEAAFFVNTARIFTKYIDLPLVCDMEDKAFKDKKRAKLNSEIYNAFAKVVSEAGFVPCIYTNASFLKSYLVPEDEWNIWYARWTDKDVELPNNCIAHQYTDSGEIDGIKGKCDLNKGYFFKWSRKE